MTKFKKLFGLSLLMFAVSFFAVACETEDTPPSDEGYSVTITGGKIDGVTGSTAMFFEGDVVKITAVVPANKQFVKWTFTGVGIADSNAVKNPFSFSMPAKNITITAVFEDVEEPEPFTAKIDGGTITFTDEEGEEIVVEDGKSGIFFEEDKLILLSAEIPEGYRFGYWDVTPSIYNDNFYEYPNGALDGNPLIPTDRYVAAESWFYMPAADVEIKAVFLENVGYDAAINGGTITFEDEEGEEIVVEDGEKGIFYGADRLVLLSAEAPEGKVFIRWDVTPAKYNDNFYVYDNGTTDRYESENSWFYMPDDDVEITAVFGDAPDYVDGNAEVRFTWEAVEQDKILAISASEADVEAWWEQVSNDPDFDPESMTDIPLFDGSPELPDNIYSSTLASTEYKSKYLPISEGMYTAVCSGEDEFGYFDIVANYPIVIDPATATANGIDLWYEIAFDVGTFLSEPGMEEFAWFLEVDFDDETDPRLEKKKGKKFFVKKVTSAGSKDVTYYVIRRAKKA